VESCKMVKAGATCKASYNGPFLYEVEDALRFLKHSAAGTKRGCRCQVLYSNYSANMFVGYSFPSVRNVDIYPGWL
jgi:hypothetical protein